MWPLFLGYFIRCVLNSLVASRIYSQQPYTASKLPGATNLISATDEHKNNHQPVAFAEACRIMVFSGVAALISTRLFQCSGVAAFVSTLLFQRSGVTAIRCFLHRIWFGAAVWPLYNIRLLNRQYSIS